jgi:hypothetical protein
MKTHKIEAISCGRASRGWIIMIEVRISTKRQCTMENHAFSNADMELKPSNSLFVSLIRMYFTVIKEIRELQKLPGVFEIR